MKTLVLYYQTSMGKTHKLINSNLSLLNFSIKNYSRCMNSSLVLSISLNITDVYG